MSALRGMIWYINGAHVRLPFEPAFPHRIWSLFIIMNNQGHGNSYCCRTHRDGGSWKRQVLFCYLARCAHSNYMSGSEGDEVDMPRWLIPDWELAGKV